MERLGDPDWALFTVAPRDVPYFLLESQPGDVVFSIRTSGMPRSAGAQAGVCSSHRSFLFAPILT